MPNELAPVHSPMSIRFRPPKAFFVTVGHIEAGFPKSLDHFRIYRSEFDSSGKHVRALDVEKDLIERGYGRILDNGEPRLERVPIFFVANDVKMNLHSYLAFYGSSVCWCRCTDFDPNAENAAVRRLDKVEDVGGKRKRIPTGEVQKVKCPCKHYGQQCSEYTRLYFQIKHHERYGAFSILRTKSYHTRNSLASSLYMMSMQLRGHIAGIDMELSVEIRKGEGKKFPVVHLCAPANGLSLHEMVTKAAAIPAIDETPEARRNAQWFLEDRSLDIATPEEIRAVYAIIEPRHKDPEAIETGEPLTPPEQEPIDDNNVVDVPFEERDDFKGAVPSNEPTDEEKEAIRRQEMIDEGYDPDTGERIDEPPSLYPDRRGR